MDLSDIPRKPRAESIVPMINVVFLLLIFFLMTSQIAPPEPFPVEVPQAQSEQEAESDAVLYIDATGTLSFDGVTGAAALDQLTAIAPTTTTLTVKADGRLEANLLAVTLGDLTRAGFSDVALVVTPR